MDEHHKRMAYLGMRPHSHELMVAGLSDMPGQTFLVLAQHSSNALEVCELAWLDAALS